MAKAPNARRYQEQLARCTTWRGGKITVPSLRRQQTALHPRD